MIPEKKRPKFVDRFENFTEENERRSRFNIGKEGSALDYSSLLNVDNYIDAFKNEPSDTTQVQSGQSEFVSSAYSLNDQQKTPIFPADMESRIKDRIDERAGKDLFVDTDLPVSHREDGIVDTSLFIDEEEEDFSLPDVESAFINEDTQSYPAEIGTFNHTGEGQGLTDGQILPGTDPVSDRYKTYTEYGGGISFDNRIKQNGKIVTEKVTLNKFKDRNDKKGFKSKAENVFDKASRAVDLVKPEENEAAASNIDEKAIVATLIAKGVIDDKIRRYGKIRKGLKKDIKQINKEIKAARVSDAGKKGQDAFNEVASTFNNSRTEFVDKFSVFTDRYEGIFRDPISEFRADDYFGASSFTAAAVLSPNVAAIQKSVDNSRLKQKRGINKGNYGKENNNPKDSNFSDTERFERTEVLNTGTRNDDTVGAGGGEFEATTISENESKIKRSVESYFSGDDKNNGKPESDNSGNKTGIESTSTGDKNREREKEQKKSEEKRVKKAEKNAKKKAAAIASLTAMLKMKKELQNSIGDISGEVSGDLIKDGSKGIISGVIGLAKDIVLTKIRLIIIQALASLFGLIMQGLVMFLPIIVIVFLFCVVLTGQLAVFTDSIPNPFLGVNMPGSGDGNVYHSLSEAEVDEIIEDLYINYPGEMNSTQEALLRYGLSKVGCTYNQAYHSSLTADIFDCSSLAYRAYRAVGIDISNNGIYTAAEECRFAVNSGHSVMSGDLIPGDLIFYGGSSNGRFMGTYHVGIYVGNGKMVEARGRSSGVVYCDVRTNHAVLYARYAA